MGITIRILLILSTGVAILMLQIQAMSTDSAQSQEFSDTFVDLKQVLPSIQLDIKYHTEDNFIGDPIEGYTSPTCLLTQAAAQALIKVQQELLDQNYSLRIYDCYRPQRAVDHFVRWAADLIDIRMKPQYYPHVAKQDLFSQGYISSRSSHSRGSTVDLTLVKLKSPPNSGPHHPVDMGSEFDFFDPISHTFSQNITVEQKSHRILLKTTMERHGFRNYDREWWHYTLIDEPYPNTYFDFPLS